MCKEGCCVGLGRTELRVDSGNCLKYLKKGVEQKIGKGKQRF